MVKRLNTVNQSNKISPYEEYWRSVIHLFSYCITKKYLLILRETISKVASFSSSSVHQHPPFRRIISRNVYLFGLSSSVTIDHLTENEIRFFWRKKLKVYKWPAMVILNITILSCFLIQSLTWFVCIFTLYKLCSGK